MVQTEARPLGMLLHGEQDKENCNPTPAKPNDQGQDTLKVTPKQLSVLRNRIRGLLEDEAEDTLAVQHQILWPQHSQNIQTPRTKDENDHAARPLSKRNTLKKPTLDLPDTQKYSIGTLLSMPPPAQLPDELTPELADTVVLSSICQSPNHLGRSEDFGSHVSMTPLSNHTSISVTPSMNHTSNSMTPSVTYSANSVTPTVARNMTNSVTPSVTPTSARGPRMGFSRPRTIGLSKLSLVGGARRMRVEEGMDDNNDRDDDDNGLGSTFGAEMDDEGPTHTHNLDAIKEDEESSPLAENSPSFLEKTMASSCSQKDMKRFVEIDSRTCAKTGVSSYPISNSDTRLSATSAELKTQAQPISKSYVTPSTQSLSTLSAPSTIHNSSTMPAPFAIQNSATISAPSITRNSATSSASSTSTAQNSSTSSAPSTQNSARSSYEHSKAGKSNTQMKSLESTDGATSRPSHGAFGSLDRVIVNGVTYCKLEVVGRGGTSQVFRVLSPEGKVLALKQVRTDTEPGLREAVLNEIELMRLFKKMNLTNHIIELIDAEVKDDEEIIYVVMECGEIDLAHLLQRHRELSKEGSLNDNFICMNWEQMLHAVDAIHEARVIHGDLKPANFLCVQGTLKLIDFGIAKQSSADTTKIARDTQVGTVNYMSPESITAEYDESSEEGMLKLGRASDVWSLGCILYQMAYGKTPFAHLRTIYQKLQAIPDPKKPISFPSLRNPHLLDVLKRCLQRNPSLRPTISELLKHPLLSRDQGQRQASPSFEAKGASGETKITLEELPNILKQISALVGSDAVTKCENAADVVPILQSVVASSRGLTSNDQHNIGEVNVAAIPAPPALKVAPLPPPFPMTPLVLRRPPIAQSTPTDEIDRESMAGKTARGWNPREFVAADLQAGLRNLQPTKSRVRSNRPDEGSETCAALNPASKNQEGNLSNAIERAIISWRSKVGWGDDDNTNEDSFN